MINPLSYFAEHNMSDLNGTFETGHDASGLYLFNWSDAMTAYNTNPATLNDKSYYPPTIQEWRAIIPESSDYVYFSGSGTRTLSGAAVTIGGKNYTMGGTFDNVGNVVYATFTYTSQSNPTLYAIARYRTENMSANNPNARMVVDMQLTATPYTIDQVKNVVWNGAGVFSRLFPAAGWRFPSGTLLGQGTTGVYWSYTELDSDTVKDIYFYSGFAHSDDNAFKTYALPIRLVSRN